MTVYKFNYDYDYYYYLLRDKYMLSRNLSANFIHILHNESCVDAVTPRVAEGNSSTAGIRA